ncbi:MAG: hypothetical protein HYX89_08875 [Chloroflexi bacterium]|nr:hypothetical protein [Chloroflexota bacterium]
MVGVASFWAAFGILGFATIWLLWNGDPLVYNYRTTIQYKSAIIGDGVLVPLINMIIVSQLLEWKSKLNVKNLLRSASISAVISFSVALFQAQDALVNWTMPSPYQWTWLGYYHAVFMMAELTLLIAFFGHLLPLHRLGLLTSTSYRRLGFILVAMLIFGILLAGDYGLSPRL